MFLARQKAQYGIYLIEPIQNLTFNRGLLMNIGFIEAIKQKDIEWDCFFFHDVDMLPELNSNFYRCDPEIPLHYAVAVNKFDYK
jgi:beta-1,4-galactosyltransferase 3